MRRVTPCLGRAMNVALVLTASAGVMFAPSFSVQAEAAQQEAAPPTATLPVVSVAPAQLTRMVTRVPVSGSLVARQEVMIYPNVTGYAITQIMAEVGDEVSAGQELARLQDRTLQAQLAQADADYQRAEAGVKQAQSQILSADAALTEARSTLERARKLRQSGSGSQATLDQAVAAEAAASASSASAHDGLSVAQAALALADASRDIARLNLDYTRILSPVAGKVVARNAELGALSGSAAAPLFTVIAGGEIELAADIVETAIPALQVGAPVAVTISGLGEVQGRVRLTPAAVDPETRLGLVRISLDEDAKLRIGLFASGWIILQDHEALSVPATAVVADETGDYVQVVKDGQVETRLVKAGVIWQGRREILQGLEPNENVIARAGAFFRSGDRITPVAVSKPDVGSPPMTDAAPDKAKADAAGPNPVVAPAPVDAPQPAAEDMPASDRAPLSVTSEPAR